MSNSIHEIRLSHLSGASMRSFFVRINQILAPLKLTGGRINSYQTAFDAFSAALDDETKARRSLKSYDTDCDNAWLLLMAEAKASSIHFAEPRRTAGIKINDIVSSIGNVTYLSYDVEYANILKALNQLEALDIQVLKDAHVDDIVPHLHDCYDAFIAAQHDENIQRAAYQTGTVRAARDLLISTWAKLTAFLELLAEDDASIDQAISEINRIVVETKIPAKKSSTIDDSEIDDK